LTLFALNSSIVSRCFFPSVRIHEDPVTGSAHCLRGAYWSERMGRAEIPAHQASARGGDLRVTVHGDRVTLAGHAVTIFRGTLFAPMG
jgi:predicted PhzF superfamily epimerase YddE/YHI9